MRGSLAVGDRDRSILVVEKLGKKFRGKTALEEVSFEVPPASFTVILGAAGAGKTTTLRIIAGLDRPDSGSVTLAGNDVGRWEPKDRNIAMILDNLALYPNKTGFENIANPLVIRRIPKSEIEARVAEVAATLKISHILKRLPRTMSGGERQRIALGRALIRTPHLFLLDEPLSSLDAMLRIELRAELKRLQRELGYTFLMATPDYNEALAIADTVIMLREGRVVQIARPQDLYNNPVDREVARFVGSPLVNIIPARHLPGEGGGIIETAGARLPVPEHLETVFRGAACDFELGIRPENLRLTIPATTSPAASDTPPAPAAITGTRGATLTATQAPTAVATRPLQPGGARSSSPSEVPASAITATLIDIEPLGLKSVLTVRNEEAELRLLVETAVTRDITPGQTVGVELTNTPLLLAFDPATGQRWNQ